MIEIDASLGEGGGQVVRTATAMSVITGVPIRLVRIRSTRPKPGLRHQQLAFLSSVTEVSATRMSGVSIGSEVLTVHPGPIRGGSVASGAGVPVSVPLVLDALLPICAYAERITHLRVEGATDLAQAMTFDYFVNVLLAMQPFARLESARRELFPGIAGYAELKVAPTSFDPLVAGPGAVQEAEVLTIASPDFDLSYLTECEASTRLALRDGLQTEPAVVTRSVSTGGHGAFVTVVCRLQNGSVVGGSQQVDLHQSAVVAGTNLVKEVLAAANKGGIDRYAADSTLLRLALGGGEVELAEVTQHATTTMRICEQICGPTFKRDGNTISVSKPLARRLLR